MIKSIVKLALTPIFREFKTKKHRVTVTVSTERWETGQGKRKGEKERGKGTGKGESGRGKGRRDRGHERGKGNDHYKISE